MYAVAMIKQSTKEVVELLGFASNQSEVDKLIDDACRHHGADWIGTNGFGFAVMLAA